MKKLLATAALFAATSSFAGVTGFGTYDFDRANDGQGFHTANEIHMGAAVDTKLGTFDASLAMRQLSPKSGIRDNAFGGEVGYTNGLTVGGVAIKGRAAIGRINHVDADLAGFTGNTQYYSLAAEAEVPFTPVVSGFVGYRFRDAFNGTGPTSNRYTVGADFSLSKTVSVRAGYAFLKQDGLNFNGLTTAVSYKF